MRTPELCRIMELPASAHTTSIEQSYITYTKLVAADQSGRACADNCTVVFVCRKIISINRRANSSLLFPLPVTNLWHVLAVFVDVLFALNQLILESASDRRPCHRTAVDGR